MLRPAPLPWVLAAAVGLALTAPAGCHDSQAEPVTAALADTTARATADAAAADAAELHAAPDTTDERPPLPDGFVRLRDVAPGIAQEMRYATAYNFVGEPIEGYLAPECILAEEAAEALGSVARALANQGLGLKVYDCYRPASAVRRFATWTGEADQSMKGAFYPAENKGSLFSRGYIATRSGHSRGATVDLTLVRVPVAASVRTEYPALDALTPCTAPRAERFDEGDLDMGTAYDCFSPLAATDNPGISAEARRNRQQLRAAMSAGGFRNYAQEWWHYTLRAEPHASTYFDFPVE